MDAGTAFGNEGGEGAAATLGTFASQSSLHKEIHSALDVNRALSL